MALHTILINHNTGSQRNLCLVAVAIGIIMGFMFGCCGIFCFSDAKSFNQILFFVICLVLGAASGFFIIFFYGREVLRAIILLVSRELTNKVGLKPNDYYSKKIGMNRDLDNFNQMFKMILSVLKRVLLISLKLESASSDLDNTAQTSSLVIKEIVDGVGAIDKKAGNNASNLRETINSLEDSFILSKDISSKLTTAKESSQNVSGIAAGTQMSVKAAVQTMQKVKELTDGSALLVNDLNDRSKQIGTILTEIANIAEKTNLLALNAAIEAARAGEHGLGFAVVAEEVRKLARGSAESSKKINILINDILQKTENAAEMMQNNTTHVNQGMQVIQEVESTLGTMVNTTNDLNEIINNISLSAERQSQTSDEMYKKVNTISQITDDISNQIKSVASTALSRTVIVDQTNSSAKELRILSDVFQNTLVPFDFHVDGANKRSAIRTETRIPCKFRVLLSGEMVDSNFSGNDYTMRGVITNLSAGGCVIETSEDVEQGKYLVIAFQIGTNFIQGIQGRLVRQKLSLASNPVTIPSKSSLNIGVQQAPEPQAGSTRECIISFNNLSKDLEAIIVEFVMNAQKQFESNLGLTE